VWVVQDTLAREITSQRIAQLATMAALTKEALPAFTSACSAVSMERYWDGQNPAAAVGLLRRRSQLLDLLVRTMDHRVLRVCKRASKRSCNSYN
jgi:sigma54-dependent transcription regulator